MRLKLFIAGTIAAMLLTISAVRLLSQSDPIPINRLSNPSVGNYAAEAVGNSRDQLTCDHVMSYEPFKMTYEQCFGRTRNVNMMCELLAREHVPTITTQEGDVKYTNILTVCPIAMLLNYPMTINDGVIEVEIPRHRK